MTALDPGSADRILTIPTSAFSSLAFGDATLIPYDQPTHPVIVTPLGRMGIPREWEHEGVTWLDVDGEFEHAAEWTLIVAVEIIGDASWGLGINGDSFELQAATGLQDLPPGFPENLVSGMANGVWLPDPMDPEAIPPEFTPDTVNVFALTGNAAESFLTVDGDGVLAVGDGGVPTLGWATINPDNAPSVLVGMWMWEGVALSQVDVVDTVDAIAAAFREPGDEPEPAVTFEGRGGWQVAGAAEFSPPPEPIAFEARGGWQITGAAEFTTEDLDEDPPVEIEEPGGSVTPPDPPAPPVPPDFAPEPIRHVWQTLPAPSLNASGIDPNWMPTAEGNAPYARMQITVEGTDVTYWAGAATPEPDWSETEPFGWGPATLRFPQLTVFHARPAWARIGANVLFRWQRVANSSWETLYQGVVTRVNDRQDSGNLSLECTGLLYVADLQLRKPAFTTTPLDIGTAIARTVNGIVSRRTTAMQSVVTGIRTSVLGGWEPNLTGYLANILATALSGGRQWTLMLEGRQPVLRRKNTTTVAWEVRAGQPGVTIDLGSDGTEAINVVYGEGINPDGGRWRNAKYPNWRPDDTPPYPNVNPAKTHSTGARDSHTDSGTGISDWERKAGLTVDGLLSRADVAAMRRLQRAAGIQDDGWLGPQTWAATFGTGSNTGSLDGAFIAPLAIASEVQPRRYGPDGDDLGANPAYDANVLRVERKIDYGQGVTRTEGARNAREVLARDSIPGFVGTVTFDRMDPSSRHRFELRAGQNGRIRGWRGQDLIVHAAAARKTGQQMTLTVDTRARDYPTLRAIIERDRAATDPARTARQRLLHGRIATDRPVYDAESPGGRIPRHPLFGGLWNVLRIPMGDYGRIVRTEFRTSGPPRGFAVAVFGKAVTANRLVSAVGNPLTASSNPWDKDLDHLGLLQAWGWNKQRVGYWPGQYSTPDSEQDASPLTGRFVDDASWEYASERSPWLWVAMIATGPCYVEGRLYGAAD